MTTQSDGTFSTGSGDPANPEDATTTNNAQSDTESVVTENALIQSIYTIALEPHAYDAFMDRWEDHVTSSLEKLGSLRDSTELEDHASAQQTTLNRHFAIGFQLLEEMGRAQEPNAFFAPDGPPEGKPSLLFDAKGRLVWFNGSAAALFKPGSGDRVNVLNLDAPGRAVMDRLLAQAMERQNLADVANNTGTSPGKTSNGDAKRGAQFEARGDTRPGIVRAMATPNASDEPAGHDARAVTMTVHLIEDRSGDQLVLLREAGPSWHPEAGNMMTSDFGLTGAELAVVQGLVEGRSVQAIADARSLSVETVRKQLKGAMARTGTRSQNELLRVALTFVDLAEKMTPVETPTKAARAGESSQFQIRGRSLPVFAHGPADGHPVLFFHGMLDGCDLTPAADAALQEANLRLICPVRPHFGASPVEDCPIADAPHMFAHDVEDLLVALNIEQDLPLVLLGHMAGSVYASAAAERLAKAGRNIAGVVQVSGGVPIVSSTQFASMSRRQRLTAYTARYTPSLLPFLLRAGIRQLDYGGEDAFMQALYESSPRDLDTLNDVAIREVVSRGYSFTVAQGLRAFEVDAWHVVRDWSPLVDGSDVPIICVHGRHDTVVSAQSVEDFAKRYPGRAQVRMQEELGQLVLYPKMTAVVDAVTDLLGEAGNG